MAQRKEKKVITFPVKLDPSLHKALKHVAVEEDMPLQRLIVETLTTRIESNDFLAQAKGINSGLARGSGKARNS